MNPRAIEIITQKYGRPPTENEIKKIRDAIAVYMADGSNIGALIDGIIERAKEPDIVS